jgi:hypothetical protein
MRAMAGLMAGAARGGQICLVDPFARLVFQLAPAAPRAARSFSTSAIGSPMTASARRTCTAVALRKPPHSASMRARVWSSSACRSSASSLFLAATDNRLR